MEQLNYKIDVFEGPMDLLLHLISKHKLNINDIPIVELVNQYLDYVRQMQEQDFDIAGEFLEMAARLIYIKTVSLLPRHEEAEILKKELTGELIEYQDCKIMAGKLAKQTDGFNRFVRQPEEGHINYDYERFHEGEELLSAYINAAGRGRRKLPPPLDSFKVIVAKKFVAVASKVSTVMKKLFGGKKVKFLNLFTDAETKSDMVATFLAVLELAKTKKILIDGEMNNPTVRMMDEVNNIMASLEAMLFAAGDPVEPGKLAEVLDVDVENVIKMLGHLEAMYDENNRGLRLIRIDGKYQLCTREEYSDEVRGLLEIKKNTPLSQAAFEVLAIVAYNKTVTRSFIEQIRGVDCSGPVSNLIQKGLIEEKGRLDLPGRPLVYGTTDRFLRCFSLNSLDDLPDLPEEEKQDDSQTSLFEDEKSKEPDIPDAETFEEGVE